MSVIVSSSEDSDWIRFRKKFYFFVQYAGIILPTLGATMALIQNNANWYFFVCLIFYFGIAGMDVIFGTDEKNPNEEDEKYLRESSYYDNVLASLVPLYVLTYSYVAYSLVNLETTWYQYAAAVIGTGAMFSGIFVVSHELGHRTRNPFHRLLARIAISLFGYGHFHIEHNRGHHVHVATPEDGASSRMGENVYQFMTREIPSTIKRAYELETLRLERLGLGFWSMKNEILQAYAMTLSFYIFLAVTLGAEIIPFLLLSVIIGYFQLTMANYFEHYGLLRKKLENDKYSRCEPEHSWNSNHLFSNMLTLQLQRHSDHHFSAARPYQVLRDHESVPQLPTGYPFLEFICIFPPLWRKLMDPRLLEFVDYDMTRVNTCPKKHDALFAKYHMKRPTKI